MMSQTSTDKKTALTIHKKLIFVTLAAAALTLSACGKKDAPVVQADPAVDNQASVEKHESAVAHDEVAVASANEGMATTDMPNDDVAVATADDSK
ncbi:hypothetical protein [Psychrobacter urativorans]|uniref:hypothetical protein n=1 Tax=Psychrobacter urativorans TaxID=45610 RepID=UPI000AA26E4B|nr:hypothetical protein [Psychrobacter urativorans]